LSSDVLYFIPFGFDEQLGSFSSYPLLYAPVIPPPSHWKWLRSHASFADWSIWSQCIWHVATTTVLGDWLHPPHLSSFLPFDLTASTTYVLQPSGLWFCFCPLHSHLPHNFTLQFSGIATQLPSEFSFAHLSKLTKDTLVLSGYQTFSLLLVPDSLPLDPVRFVFPSDPFPLIQAI